ncbi:hypothetical protein [Chryseobacterium sp. SIMBA_038]|uniref:hypothetical protein n=3 Tax=Bacteria TaxID=2 RepID=UPI00397B698A
MKTKQELKKYFENGDIPNQEQFWEWQDSYWHKYEKISSDKIDIDLSQKADLVNGKVPAAQLPSYVDDVLEFNSLSALPAQGEAGKIYITTDNDKLYRWTGTRYVDITQGDVGTLQKVTERGSETSENIKIQGIYFGGNDISENIVIGNQSKDVNLNATNTIAIGAYATPLGTDNIGIGKGVMNNSDSSGLGNIGLGHYAMQDALGANENIAIGFNTFNNSLYAQGNNVIGTNAGTGSGNSINFNNIIGYSAGRVLGSGSNNNLILGNNSNFSGSIFSNKLYIHSSSSTPNVTVSDALISGDFVDRYVNINGVFSVTSGKMPSADSNYTKNIVAKPDGTFGWENKVEYIALTGTEDTKPVTGNILIKDNSGSTRLSAGYVFVSDATGNETVMSSSSIKFMEGAAGAAGMTKTGITTLEGEFTIACYKPDGRGIIGQFDHTKNLEELDYVQKKYVDKKHSYSTHEEKTGGTWINDKPIYRKTVVFDTIPSNGEIDITTDFPDIEVIVSNQMFTEWWARDFAFAGNHWRGVTFITLKSNMVAFEDVNAIDYSQIDSFTLTLEYTKTTD